MAPRSASKQPINTQLQRGRKSTQRERLLAGMIAAANQSGYAGASVSEVIGRAGVSRPTFYDYFADRDECFVAGVTDVQQRLLGEVREAVRSRAPADALEATIEALVGFAIAEPAMARFLTKETLAGETGALDARDRGTAEIAQIVEQAFARVGPEQALPDLPLPIAIGAIQRLLASRLRRRERELSGTLEDLLDWARSYERPVREHRWRTLSPASGIAPSPFLPAMPLRAPAPLPPGRPRISEEAVAENHRLRIMFATSQVVAERGYTAATIAEITKLAGVDARAFYRLFTDKQDAFSATYEHGFQQTMAVVARAYFAGEDWPERMWEALRAATQGLQGNPTAAHVGFVAAYAVGPGAIQRVEDSRLAFTIFLQEGYRHQQTSNHPPPLALEAIVASLFEILYHEARSSATHKPAGLLPHLMHLCLTPYIGAEQSDRFIDRKLKEDGQGTHMRHNASKHAPQRARVRGAAQIA